MIDANELWRRFVQEMAKTRSVKSRYTHTTHVKPIALNEEPTEEIQQALSAALETSSLTPKP